MSSPRLCLGLLLLGISGGALADLTTTVVPSSAVGDNVPVSMTCAVPEADQDKLASCVFYNPSGTSFTVNMDNGDVDGGNNDMMGNVGDYFCQVNLTYVNAEDFGKWMCDTATEGGLKQLGILNVITTTRVSGVYLPTQLTPTNYDVLIVPDFDASTFSGNVKVYFTAEEATSEIYLHTKKLQVDQENIVLAGAGVNTRIDKFGFDTDRDFFILYLNQEVAAGTDFTVALDFTGPFVDDLAGFYKSYYEEGSTRHELGITQFQSTDARKAFPCQDEPDRKATFNMVIRAPQKYISVRSNMPATADSPQEDGNDYVWTFEETLPMSTYLVAFLVSEFGFTEGTDARFKIWSQPALTDQTEYAASIGPTILQYYETIFDEPFPLPKQDMVAVPQLSFGGMENWGLITYRESALLFEENVTSIQSKERLTNVVSHELAHMWFGDLVTMEWWSDLWLNEGFATYVSYLGQGVSAPEFDAMDRFVLDNTQLAFVDDALESSHPIQANVQHPDEINEIFDNISYEKGAALVRMMAYFMGFDTFMDGIKNYIDNHKYGNANQNDLWDELNLVANNLPADLTIAEVMDSWTKQKGYPILHVDRINLDTVELRQERFLFGEPENTLSEYLWNIPVSYTSSSSDEPLESASDTKVWFNREDGANGNAITVDLDLPSLSQADALIFNVQQTGYYRVNYDLENWMRIIEAIRTNVTLINRINRAQIIDDALNLAKGGYLNYTIALSQLDYMANELDYIPWRAATRNLAYLQLMFEANEMDLMELNYHFLKRLEPLYYARGFEPQPEETYFGTIERELAVSHMCLDGEPVDYLIPAAADCRTKSMDAFQAWYAEGDPDFDNPIDPGIRQTVYCTAISSAIVDNFWEWLFDRYSASQNANDRSSMIYGLGCSRNAETLEMYLNMLLDEDSEIAQPDALSVVSSVASNPVGNPIAWQWMQDNWAAIVEKYDTAVSSPVGRMVSAVTAPFNTLQRYQELDAFYDENFRILGTAEAATKNALATTQANIVWMEGHHDEILQWLPDITKLELETTTESGVGRTSPLLPVLAIAASFILSQLI